MATDVGMGGQVLCRLGDWRSGHHQGSTAEMWGWGKGSLTSLEELDGKRESVRNDSLSCGDLY